MPENVGKIYEAINGAMADIGAIGKTKKNQQQGFLYRGIDDVMNVAHDILVKHGIFVTPEVLDQTREERTTSKGTSLIYSICRMKYTFYASDGSSVSAVVVGEGMDSGDKATNKAMSIALKYAMFQVLCIPTEEMEDPDAESHEVKPKTAQQKKKAETIGSEKAKEFFSILEKEGILPETVNKLYGVSSISNLTDAQLNNAKAHLSEIKAKQEGK